MFRCVDLKKRIKDKLKAAFNVEVDPFLLMFAVGILMMLIASTES